MRSHWLLLRQHIAPAHFQPADDLCHVTYLCVISLASGFVHTPAAHTHVSLLSLTGVGEWQPVASRETECRFSCLPHPGETHACTYRRSGLSWLTCSFCVKGSFTGRITGCAMVTDRTTALGGYKLYPFSPLSPRSFLPKTLPLPLFLPLALSCFYLNLSLECTVAPVDSAVRFAVSCFPSWSSCGTKSSHPNLSFFLFQSTYFIHFN